MSDEPRPSAAPVEACFDRTLQPSGDGPPDPLVSTARSRGYASPPLISAANRVADMRYISGLDRATAERQLRWRPAVAPGGLGFGRRRTGEKNSPPRSAVGTCYRIGRCRPPRYRLLECIGRVYCTAGRNLGEAPDDRRIGVIRWSE